MTPSRVALGAVQTEESLRGGSGGFWQRWLCREGLRALSFGVRMAVLGCFAPQQLHPKLFPHVGSQARVSVQSRGCWGRAEGGGWARQRSWDTSGHPMARNPTATPPLALLCLRTCPFPAGLGTPGTGRAAKSAFHTPWPLVVPLEPPNLPWGHSKTPPAPVDQLHCKAHHGCCGIRGQESGIGACRGLEQLQLLTLVSPCSLSLIRY